MVIMCMIFMSMAGKVHDCFSKIDTSSKSFTI